MFKRYIVYCLEECPFCVDAIDLLVSSRVDYDVIYLDKALDVLDNIKIAYDWDTVPLIFATNDNYIYQLIGGFSDLKTLFEDDE